MPEIKTDYACVSQNIAQIIDRRYKSRVSYYADRIRGIRVRSGDIDKTLGRALATWLSKHSDAPLLPNLNYLHWEDSTLALYPCLRAFSGPRLTTLKLTVEPWPEEYETHLFQLFSSLREACPLLTAIEVEDDNDGMFEGSGQQLSLILSAFPSITRAGFWIEPSSDTMLALATMPNLHTVINRLYPTEDLGCIEPILPSLQFPALQVLRWSVAKFKDATVFLSRLQPGVRDLQGLAIRCDSGNFDPSEITSFFDAVRATCSPHTLTSFLLEAADDPRDRLTYRQPYREATRTPGLASSLLRPLRRFDRMEECRIAKLPMVLDNQLIEDLTNAWPFIQRLELLARLPGESKITLAALHTIAARCHHLEHLEVEIGSWSDNVPDPSYRFTRSDKRNKTRIVEIHYNNFDGLNAEREGRHVVWTQMVQSIFPHADIKLSCLPHWPVRNVSEEILMDLV
ncbi:hypothetical protein EWM64_g8320 [Hericium alpestre]|uniref:F-box domain-containing protein n=1 Tax=Hericium alpestre TaxID=135208 RepID=A0A4Y9ZLP5_9AGAM|nr:hypothetical protein EWM64_g8320 [Hericium alpestre]